MGVGVCGDDWSKKIKARDMAVKVLEMVHCGECRFAESNNCPMYRAHFRHTDNDFCSIGKPKEQRMSSIKKDDIDTLRITFNADIECLCNQGKLQDARELEEMRDRVINALKQEQEHEKEIL